jgi:hypothetical protein
MPAQQANSSRSKAENWTYGLAPISWRKMSGVAIERTSAAKLLQHSVKRQPPSQCQLPTLLRVSQQSSLAQGSLGNRKCLLHLRSPLRYTAAVAFRPPFNESVRAAKSWPLPAQNGGKNSPLPRKACSCLTVEGLGWSCMAASLPGSDLIPSAVT